MEPQKYLEEILKAQKLEDDSQELKDLQARRKDVEKILRDGFSKASPTIRYGGSKAKDTLIREAYDLDIVCYFPHDDTTAGETLKDPTTTMYLWRTSSLWSTRPTLGLW